MTKYLGRCALWMALFPATAWAQASCMTPVLPDTEVSGWHDSPLGGVIVGTARYRIFAKNASRYETVTLGIAFSHKAGDESHATAQPASRELPDLMTASLQVRFVRKDGVPPRGWDADEADVLLDGKRFPAGMRVIGAPDRTRDIAANWEVWFSDGDLLAAMENAREMEVRMRHTPTSSFGSFHFDIASFKGMRAQLVPYWRCSAIPYHLHRH
ncbi:hypothetical protein [Pseudoxanthomonas sp. CF385]|uniref:hypothetical protein n=1 Tax=Pseudoxanthomonas sp. CF385 TaxID=1881042 RepID=UPI001113CF77|nr:hypothetical protein [Pseudoxanthomonas sp. CF385]